MQKEEIKCNSCGVYIMDGETCQNCGREINNSENPFSKQVGGMHYKHFTIEPALFCEINKISFIVGDCIKRLCRYQHLTDSRKKLLDLEKIKHETEMLIWIEKQKQEQKIEILLK